MVNPSLALQTGPQFQPPPLSPSGGEGVLVPTPHPGPQGPLKVFQKMCDTFWCYRASIPMMGQFLGTKSAAQAPRLLATWALNDSGDSHRSDAARDEPSSNCETNENESEHRTPGGVVSPKRTNLRPRSANAPKGSGNGKWWSRRSDAGYQASPAAVQSFQDSKAAAIRYINIPARVQAQQ